MNFDDLNISNELNKSLKEMGFSKLTPIQEVTIPHAFKGRDIIGQSQTGSGKTIAFSIPIIEKIFVPDNSPQAIILCPTRELCIQITSQISKLISNFKKLKVLGVYGGQSIGKQTRVLKKGVHIIVGTPGRVIDHINRETLDLTGVETVVLDEADEMLKMGFKDDLEEILGNIPYEHQTFLFSATIPSEIKQMADKFLNNPEFFKISNKSENIPKIKQFALKCDIEYKFKTLTGLLNSCDFKLTLIFCNTKKSVDFVKRNLKKENFSVDSIHGDMPQKLRDKVMNKFLNGNVNILVASDIASRGLDIDDIDIIVNYDVPLNFTDYTHRIGRTARAGKSGFAYTLVSKDEISRYNNIKKLNNVDIDEI